MMKKLLFFFTTFLIVQWLYPDTLTDSLRMLMRSDTITEEGILETYDSMIDYLLQHDIEECRTVCWEGINYAKNVNNYKYESTFITYLGATYYNQGDYKITAEFWFKALHISENAKDTPRIEQMYNNLGILYKTMNEYEISANYLRKSLEWKLRSGNKLKIAIMQMNIGVLFHKMQLYDSAYVYLNQALEVIRNSDDKKALALIYNNLGSVYMAKKNHTLSLENYLKAYELINYMPIYEHAIVLMNIGTSYLHHFDNLEKGREYLEKSFEIAKVQNNLRVISNIYEVYDDYYHKKGDYKKAFEYLELHKATRDSLFTLEKDLQIKEMQANFDFERKEQELNQQMEIERIESERQKRINQVMIAIIAFGILILGTISYLFIKVRKAKREIEVTQNELKQSNAELIKAKTETERALEFKSQFLANMSHEVRTPLNAIIGFNSKLKQINNDKKTAEYIDAIEIGSYNLLSLLNDILDMSKLEAGKIIVNPVNINLKSLINEIWFSFNLRARDNKILFEFIYDDEIPENFYVDHFLLRQIIVNLVSNALKFTQQGFIRVSVMQDDTDPKIFASSMMNLKIDVEDTGIGIKPEDQSTIFESFVQAKHNNQKVYGGTGLGLSISKKMVQLMGGDITLKSEPGKGSTFSVHLNRVSIGSPNAIEFNKSRPDSKLIDFQFTGGVLLAADDELLNRKMLKSFFEETAVELHIVDNGEELIEAARKVKPTVILSDMKMPVMNGIEAAKIIKSDPELKDIPVISFTASIDFPKLDAEIRKLFAGCINKPVDINELFYRLSFYLPTSKIQVPSNS
ncbi:MAG: tetratricopeptide repeat protein [Sphingobacteriia bacterium]|nr:tetratricopeptide repeat protein [Sphingobacteriia bacterium]